MTNILSTLKLVEIFIECDDFCKKLAAYSLENNYEEASLNPTEGTMSESEMMSVVIFYHHSGFKCFK